MKTKMKLQGSTVLPRFAVGALVVAGASAANAAVVQITFNGSYISTTGGNRLVTDFGGDGNNEINGSFSGPNTVIVRGGSRWVGFAGGGSGAWGKNAFVAAGSSVGTAFVSTSYDPISVTRRRLHTVTFSDAFIRSGQVTTGYLDVTAYASQPGEKRVTVNRLIFDDASATAPTGLTSASTGIGEWSASAVPEPSSLGLLALGAGGLLARRRRSQAA